MTSAKTPAIPVTPVTPPMQQPEHSPEPLHEPFTWFNSYYKQDRKAEFVGMTLDVCSGINACLELIHSSELQRDNGDVPILNISESARLLRLALMSSQLLANEAEKHIGWMNEFAHNRGKS